jgi:large subunit ribosomal protein L13
MASQAVPATPKVFKTYVAQVGEVKQKWFVIDASGQVLGRMATAIAMRLMGKDKPTYTRHLDTGDFVVVINAEKVKIDARKREAKTYQRWSGYLGGLKVETFEKTQQKNPEEIIMHAVRLMLPKNLLAKQMLSKLKVYKGSEHPHAAQKPEAWKPLG